MKKQSVGAAFSVPLRKRGIGMIDLIIIILAGVLFLFLLSCCFMVARLLDEGMSRHGYESKENWERKQLPDKLSRSSTDKKYGDK